MLSIADGRWLCAPPSEPSRRAGWSSPSGFRQARRAWLGLYCTKVEHARSRLQTELQVVQIDWLAAIVIGTGCHPLGQVLLIIEVRQEDEVRVTRIRISGARPA